MICELTNYTILFAFQVVHCVKNACNAGDTGDAGSMPGWGRSPGGGHGNPFQCSCLENPMDRGGWQATVPGVTKEQEMTEVTEHAPF